MQSPLLRISSAILFGLVLGLPLTAQVSFQITEIFSGQTGPDLTVDWFELRNTGDRAWVAGLDPDLWYDDESADPSDADQILGLNDIQPDELVIVLVTNDATDIDAFRTVWGTVTDLQGLQIGFVNGAGLSSDGDGVNIWLGDPATTQIVDSATYPSAAGNDGVSYDVVLAAYSTVGNASDAIATNAVAGSSGDVPNIASPGNRGPLEFNQNAPSITVDSVALTPYLDVSAVGPGAIGADLNDPSDPAATLGIPFLLKDPDDPIDSLLVVATSDNQAVVPDSGLVLTGSGANRLLQIKPAARGFATILLTVNDGDENRGNYRIDYAVSDVAGLDTMARFHYGASDGSTAIPLDEQYFWVGDDEDQIIRLYDRDQSGLPVSSFDFGPDLIGAEEIDIESSYRVGNTIYWMGSLTSAERSVVFSTIEAGSGTAATLSISGFYGDLRQNLIDYDNNDGHGFGAGALGFATGLEVEGLAANPAAAGGALLAFRDLEVDGQALLLPVTNFGGIVAGTATPNEAFFGDPILLDLAGFSLRSIECSTGGCLLLGGAAGEFRLFTWSGEASDSVEFRSVLLDDDAGGNYEGIAGVPTDDFTGTAGDDLEVQLIIDTGTFDYYGDGSEAKDLPEPNWRKFRSERVILGPVRSAPLAREGDIVVNEIMTNPAAVDDSVGEWFELFNATEDTVDLNGWIIADADTDRHQIAGDNPLLILPGSYLVLGNNADMASNGGVEVAYTYDGFAFGNSDSGDEFLLFAPDSTLVDSLSYGTNTDFPNPNGASISLREPGFDNGRGSNWCVATTAYGAGDFGTPGLENDCADGSGFRLVVTEIWPGQVGDDLTADWFEITNFGTEAWTAGVDPDLFYDDESVDPGTADLINGIIDIQAGESVIVMIDDSTAVTTFREVWSLDYQIDDIEVGWTDGAGLSQGGDAVALFLGTPPATNVIDLATYPNAPSGLSFDLILDTFSIAGVGRVEPGTNVAVATTVTAGSAGDESAVGSPGNAGPAAPELLLTITEIFPGQTGEDLTADWFELRNDGNITYTSVSDTLFYDDESADPTEADAVIGLTELPPGATAIVLVTDTPEDTTVFRQVWGPVIDLTGVAIAYVDGSGLGGGGDAVALWLGDPTMTEPIDTASYPDTDGFDGQSYDVELMAFSVVGNANGAVATLQPGGGDSMDVPNIGSPGNGLAVPAESGLEITEIFSGQAGDDLTVDWFEITNTGDTDWIAGTDGNLTYDDESQDAGDATPILGINQITAGESVVILLTDDSTDVATFRSIWGEVTAIENVQIGITDGAGLGGGGDAVTLWTRDPARFLPADTASYPDTEDFDGQSYDVSLDSFSVVGNSNNAVQTLALGGNGMDIPNIGSPGNADAIVSVPDLANSYQFRVYPNPTSNQITIELGEEEGIDRLWLFDAAGRILLERPIGFERQLPLDLSSFTAGTYFVRVLGDKGTGTRRILRQ